MEERIFLKYNYKKSMENIDLKEYNNLIKELKKQSLLNEIYEKIIKQNNEEKEVLKNINTLLQNKEYETLKEELKEIKSKFNKKKNEEYNENVKNIIGNLLKREETSEEEEEEIIPIKKEKTIDPLWEEFTKTEEGNKWIIRKTKEDRIYYANIKTKKTQWIAPEEYLSFIEEKEKPKTPLNSLKEEHKQFRRSFSNPSSFKNQFKNNSNDEDYIDPNLSFSSSENKSTSSINKLTLKNTIVDVKLNKSTDNFFKNIKKVEEEEETLSDESNFKEFNENIFSMMNQFQDNKKVQNIENYLKSEKETIRKMLSEKSEKKNTKKSILTVSLENTIIRKKFWEFCKKEFNSENIEFWQDVQEYKNLSNFNERKNMAFQIYNLYFLSNSQKELNITDEEKNEMKLLLITKYDDKNITPYLFIEYESLITGLLTDPFSRFSKTNEFIDAYNDYLEFEKEYKKMFLL
jgi:hypothetical protein